MTMTTKAGTVGGSSFTHERRQWREKPSTQSSEDRQIVPVPHHLLPLVPAFGQLLKLPLNWDSYGARRLDPRAAMFALALLAEHEFNGPLPHLVPTVGGGVNLEWCRGGDSVEIEVSPLGAVTVLIDHGGHMTEEVAANLFDPVLEKALYWASSQ